MKDQQSRVKPPASDQKPATADMRSGSGMAFDTARSLGDLKRLQDPAKFDRARFNLRLYKR